MSAIDADGHESYLSTASLAPFMGSLPVNEAHYMLNRIDEQTNHYTGYDSEIPQ